MKVILLSLLTYFVFCHKYEDEDEKDISEIYADQIEHLNKILEPAFKGAF